MRLKCPEFSFSIDFYLPPQQKLWKAGRQARLGGEGSSRKETDTKLVVSKRLSPFCHWKTGLSKTYPSHKIEVNLFVHEALRYYSKYCQKVYKEKILM